MTAAMPTKLLFNPDKSARLAYVPASHQDKYGVLARWLWERGPDNPANYPSDDDCNEVDSAGTYQGK